VPQATGLGFHFRNGAHRLQEIFDQGHLSTTPSTAISQYAYTLEARWLIDFSTLSHPPTTQMNVSSSGWHIQLSSSEFLPVLRLSGPLIVSKCENNCDMTESFMPHRRAYLRGR